MVNKLYTELSTENPFTVLFSWKSPERYWYPKNKAWYVSYSLFFVSLIAVLALIGEFILIVAIIAFVFLWFIQGSIPPQETEHTITTLGIRSFDKLYRWRNIKHFWFSYKNDVSLINLEIVEDDNPKFMKRITLLLNKDDERTIFDILIKYVDYGERDEIGYNFFLKLINGTHIPISHYLVGEQAEKSSENI